MHVSEDWLCYGTFIFKELRVQNAVDLGVVIVGVGLILAMIVLAYGIISNFPKTKQSRPMPRPPVPPIKPSVIRDRVVYDTPSTRGEQSKSRVDSDKQSTDDGGWQTSVANPLNPLSPLNPLWHAGPDSPANHTDNPRSSDSGGHRDHDSDRGSYSSGHTDHGYSGGHSSGDSGSYSSSSDSGSSGSSSSSSGSSGSDSGGW